MVKNAYLHSRCSPVGETVVVVIAQNLANLDSMTLLSQMYMMLLTLLLILASPFLVVRPMAFLIVEKTSNFAHQVCPVSKDSRYRKSTLFCEWIETVESIPPKTMNLKQRKDSRLSIIDLLQERLTGVSRAVFLAASILYDFLLFLFPFAAILGGLLLGSFQMTVGYLAEWVVFILRYLTPSHILNWKYKADRWVNK